MKNELSLEPLVALLGDDLEIRKEILSEFYIQLERDQSVFKELLSQENWEAISRLAHKYKSNFALISANMKLLNDIEHSIDSSTSELVDILLLHIDDILDFLRDYA